MRLIGNKTRLLADIERFLANRGVRGGTFIDIFSGTGSVGRHFKRRGFRVIANDALLPCHVQAVAGIEVSSYPRFDKLRTRCKEAFASAAFRSTFLFQPGGLDGTAGDPRPLAEAIHLLSTLPPREGMVFRNYAPGGLHARRYFTDDNARRIDAALELLRECHQDGALDRAELHLLLVSLLDAADRVANISGTYGAYLKSFQRSALAPLELEVPAVIESRLEHEAHRRDANALIREIRGDVLYIDPPYNDRQYAANYHILQVLAEYPQVDDVRTFESSLYGKTGLRPYDDLKSAYCVPPTASPRGQNVLSAMLELVLSARVKHVLISYNEEGILTREELGVILARFQGARTYNFKRNMRRLLHKRFCSDSDRPSGDRKGKRSYRVLDGKGRGQISEWLLYAARGGRAAAAPRTRQRAPQLLS